MSHAHLPPGPKGGIFGLDNVNQFKRDTLGFLLHVARDYGDIVYFRMGPYRIYQLHHPDYVREVLVNQADKQQKWHLKKKVMGKVLGNGILLSDGDYWKRQRRLAQPALHTRRIQNYADIMVEHTVKMLDRWPVGSEIDIAEEMMKVTMDIVARTMFDADVSGEAARLGHALRVTQEMIMLEMTALYMPTPDWVPTPRNLKENKAMKELDETVMGFIRERRASGKDHGDLLSMLMLAVDEDTGATMTDVQVRDEVITMFTAGYDTTALALAWTFYLLSLHRDVEERLVREVSGQLGRRVPTLEDLQAMHYTDMVLREALRLYPTVPFFPREVIEDVYIGEYTIPAGSVIWIAPYVLHRDPRWFEDPERFDPERFAGNYKERIPAYAYFPFGGGPRVCIGQAFAMMEAEIILSTIIQRFHLALVPGQHIEPDPKVTLHPRSGIKLKVMERAQASD